MFNINEELAKVSLIEDLVSDGYSEDFIEGLLESLEEDTPAYVCNTEEELAAAIKEMSEENE